MVSVLYFKLMVRLLPKDEEFRLLFVRTEKPDIWVMKLYGLNLENTKTELEQNLSAMLGSNRLKISSDVLT